MNPDTLTETIQKGFRLTLGATASLVDALKDPQASQEKFAAIGTNLERLTQELETKGAETEREARAVLDSVMAQVGELPNPFVPKPASEATIDTFAQPVTDVSVQTELDSLTQELTALRQEIEALKNTPS